MNATNSLDPVRVDSKAAVGQGWFRAVDAGSMPVRQTNDVHSEPIVSSGSSAVPASLVSPAATTSAPSQAWWRRGVRFVRNAVIGLSLVAAVPFTVIAIRGDGVWRMLGGNVESLRTRIDEVERLRPLMVARDASITPLAAGRLFNALHPVKAQKGLTIHAVAAVPVRIWDQLPIRDEMFAALRVKAEAGMAKEMVTAAARGFTPAEMSYLRTIAEAPVWREVERVASAPAVDILGGRYVLPFDREISAFDIQTVGFNDMKRLAYAGVSRAAYHVATGHPELAEAALKTVVSYGFVLIDNGLGAIDGLVGRVIIGIGQDGLHQLYALTGNRAGLALTAPLTPYAKQSLASAERGSRDPSEERMRIVAQVNDPAVPRTMRLEGLRKLVFASCGSVRGSLLGPSPELRSAFDAAGHVLARYPSEQAYVELMYQGIDPFAASNVPTSGITERAIMSAAIATSTLLGNPRVAACTRVALIN
jgi:hypothetical protein